MCFLSLKDILEMIIRVPFASVGEEFCPLCNSRVGAEEKVSLVLFRHTFFKNGKLFSVLAVFLRCSGQIEFVQLEKCIHREGERGKLQYNVPFKYCTVSIIDFTEGELVPFAR